MKASIEKLMWATCVYEGGVGDLFKILPNLCGPLACYVLAGGDQVLLPKKKGPYQKFFDEVGEASIEKPMWATCLYEVGGGSLQKTFAKPVWAKGFTYRPCSDDILERKQKKKKVMAFLLGW